MTPKKRRFTLVLLLIGLLSIPLIHMMAGASTPYQIRILEINDNGDFALSTQLQGTSNVTVTTMRMKQFVALREDLDGKYDAIYIGKGTYSTAGVSGQDHNTAAVMNDITHLKADTIVNSYIAKGLPVILHTSILNQAANTSKAADDQRILYSTFASYNTTAGKMANVYFVTDATLPSTVTQIKNTGSSLYKMMTQRPQFAISSSPVDYNTNKAFSYKVGDQLKFAFTTDNIASYTSDNVRANLYLSVDKVLQMGNDDLVATSSLNSANGMLNYTLPKAYSGLLYWKLEIVNTQSGSTLSNYASGVIRYQDEKTIVRVLQIMPSDNTSSSLLSATNMVQSYLGGADYQLNIKPIQVAEFNTTAYKNLNGTYDMLIFGFRDEYNLYATLTDASIKAVQNFAASGQAVMLTHDTIYESSLQSIKTKPWIDAFQTLSGQIAPKTNIGLNAVNASNSTQVVNTGLLTAYPFDLSQKPGNTNGYVGQINTTHDQYFTLNLEDPDIVSWYNIIGSNRDVQDSWNHYYTYSNGNITYSGTGHTNTGFPEWEQKLFVNTMYRAFIGSNHAPDISVTAPQDGSSKPSYLRDLVLSYTPNDWDLKDRTLYTSVKFKANGAYLTDLEIPEKAVVTGQTISQTFTNPLPKGGSLQIEILARDKQGAITTKTVTLVINPAKANLLTERKIISGVDTTTNSAVSGQPVSLLYSVTPQTIAYSSVSSEEQGFAHMAVSDILYTETLPPNLEIDKASLPKGMTYTGTAATGYTLSMPMADIAYSLTSTNGVQSYTPDKADPVTFKLNVTPTAKGAYNLLNAKLAFNDIHGTNILGTAGNYNFFIKNDIKMDASGFSSEGKMAGGGNVTLNGGFNIGSKLTNTTGSTPVLIAGGNLDAGTNGGSVQNGVAVYGGTFTGPVYKTYTAVPGKPIDFTTAFTKLTNVSSQVAALTVNGMTKTEYGNLSLTGIDPSLNVFNVSGSDISSTNSLSINVPKNSTVIVNVSGTSVSMQGGLSIKDTNGIDLNTGQVLFNFPQTNSLTIGSMGVKGTILAPQAAVSFGGSIQGTLIGASLSGRGTGAALPLFNGNVPLPNSSTDTKTTIVFPDIIFQSVVKVSSLSLKDETMLVGDQKLLIPVILPIDANNKVLTWSSDNPAVLKVTPSGETATATAISPGTAHITITTTDGSKITYTSTVNVIQPGLVITGSPTLNVNEQKTYTAVLTPANPTSTVKWSFKDPNESKATLTADTSNPWNVIIRGISPGTITMVATVTTPNGRTYTAELPVTIPNPLQLKINGPATTPVSKMPVTLSVTASPENLMPKQLQWSISSSAPDGAASLQTGTNGTAQLTALKEGTVVITVQGDGKTATHTLVITDAPALNGPATVSMGQVIDLTASLASGTLTSTSWSLSDSSVGKAKILSGANSSTLQLGGLVPGPITLNVTIGGKPLSKTITVEPVNLTFLANRQNARDNLQIGNLSTYNLKQDLVFAIDPNERLAEDIWKNVVFGTTDKDLVILNASTGQLTPLKKGTATITATYKSYPTIKATTTVTIKDLGDSSGPSQDGNRY
ncbi:DUF5057 domain-containing protein [Paenibacillus bovis]|uniref:BIG2 domain-containing protein n=1 Tax=Paenibacillus bovis TaxID=1616788 RepID=A0A172ZEN2_9BACL|nr:DUF5057 domain-containing protein [Paenibacillus bovis]ANF95737.1 hypothetical protein AR543_06795 [Paenibacillus bovis]